MTVRQKWNEFWRGFFGFFYPPLLGDCPHILTKAFWRRRRDA